MGKVAFVFAGQGAQFPGEQLRGIGEGGLAPPQERVQLDGDIAANGLT